MNENSATSEARIEKILMESSREGWGTYKWESFDTLQRANMTSTPIAEYNLKSFMLKIENKQKKGEKIKKTLNN